MKNLKHSVQTQDIRKRITCALFFLLSVIYFASAQKSPFYISEILASNRSVNYDPDYFNFRDWIEIYNNSEMTWQIGGMYLTDDTLVRDKWKIPENIFIPAKKSIIVWADGKDNINGTNLHANFKLDADGEYVQLYNHGLELVSSISFSAQQRDISFGRLDDTSNNLVFFDVPTPGKTNSAKSFVLDQATPAPGFSNKGGIYANPITVTLNYPLYGSQLFYTTDGSLPTKNSRLYAGPITVDTTTVIRARCFHSNYLPSPVVTNTYLINENINVPIVSVAIEPSHFYDDSIGLYVVGKNGKNGAMTAEQGGYPNRKANYNQPWKRSINLEYYNPNNDSGFKFEGKIKVSGGWTRDAVIRSLSFYSDRPINYKLFENKPFTDYTTFLLRNGGNDWAQTKMRDPALQSAVVGVMDIDAQAGYPAVLFINGEYWGVYHLIEKLDDDYIKTNHGVDMGQIDFQQRDRQIISGDAIHYNEVLDFVKTYDLSETENYEKLQSMIDLEEFTNYMIVEMYTSNWDWVCNGHNNVKYWRPKSSGGKWRWMLFDIDDCFNDWDDNVINETIGCHNILKALFKNAEYQQYFANKLIAAIGVVFEPERIRKHVDSLRTTMSPLMERHIDRWKSTLDDGSLPDWKNPDSDKFIQEDDGIAGPCFRSISQWNDRVNGMYTFIERRPGNLMDQLDSKLGTGTSPVNTLFSVNQPSMGNIVVNGNRIGQNDYIARFYGNFTATITAIPKPGYQLKEWWVGEYTTNQTQLITSGSNWKYLDDGTNQGQAWKEPGFDDSSWPDGNGVLGYGNGGEDTELQYGPNENNKYITYYFRKSFVVEDVDRFGDLTLHILRDDGAIVYINGKEAIRSNMPYGPVDYQTLSAGVTGGDDETNYFEYAIGKNLLLEGANLIAVEVHQTNVTSSDIGFDLRLVGTSNSITGEKAKPSKVLNLKLSNNMGIVAQFEPAKPVNNLLINEFLARNTGGLKDEYEEYDDWIEIYNFGDDTVDLSGLYLTDNLQNPTLWKIPDTDSEISKLPPKEFSLFWADNQPFQGFRHLGFQLDNSGEQIGLVQLVPGDTVFLDSLSYSGQAWDVSYGRFPDGSPTWDYLFPPTPVNSSDSLKKENPSTFEKTAQYIDFKIFPNPAGDWLNVEYPLHPGINIQYSILNVQGKVVSTGTLSGDPYRVDLSKFHPSVYIMKIKLNNTQYFYKIIKR